MKETELFAAALGLQAPWYVSDIDFSLEKKRLDIHIDFERGNTFACPCCGTPAKAYDTKTDTWRHTSFSIRPTFMPVCRVSTALDQWGQSHKDQ